MSYIQIWSFYGKGKCPKRQYICFTAEQPLDHLKKENKEYEEEEGEEEFSTCHGHAPSGASVPPTMYPSYGDTEERPQPRLSPENHNQIIY